MGSNLNYKRWPRWWTITICCWWEILWKGSDWMLGVWYPFERGQELRRKTIKYKHELINHRKSTLPEDFSNCSRREKRWWITTHTKRYYSEFTSSIQSVIDKRLHIYIGWGHSTNLNTETTLNYFSLSVLILEYSWSSTYVIWLNFVLNY